MIKTLSPYYVYVPLDDTGTAYPDYKVQVYIWQGLQASKPTLPEYEITKDNVTLNTGFDKINISNLINDFIEFIPVKSASTSLLNGVNQVWVSVDYIGDYTNIASVYSNLINYVGIKGYNYGMDGENADIPSNKILLQGTEFKVSRNSNFILPTRNKSAGNITIISYPNNEVNLTIPYSTTTDSNDYITYLWLNVADTSSDTYIEIKYSTETITLFVTEEYRYTPIDIHFVNKEGAQQVITFFKEKTESTNVKKDTYNYNNGQPINGNHQFVDFNINSKSKFSINSGFIDEGMNETIAQLLRSHSVWMYKNSNFIPLNIETSNVEYKTRVKDKLINYKIDFGYSFNDINTI